MIAEFSIDLLRTFAAVTEYGSFTQAGETLHITQAAVSMQMKRLEEAAGRRLFQKEGRSFRLTPAGETMLEHAGRILAVHNEAVAAFSNPDLMGRVRFGCPEDYASGLLSHVLTRFRRDHPSIRVDIQSAPSQDLQKMLHQDELDLCLLEGSFGEGRVVHRERVVWAASRRGRAHEEAPLPLAVYHEGCSYRKWALEALRKIGRPYWISFVSPSLTSILAAVKAGLAVAPIGASNVDDALFVLRPENGFPKLPVSDFRLCRAPSTDDRLADCFEEYIVESFKTLSR